MWRAKLAVVLAALCFAFVSPVSAGMPLYTAGTDSPTLTGTTTLDGPVVIGESLGAEIVQDGGFADDTKWTEGAGWSLATSAAVHTGGTAGTLVPTVALVPTPRTTYAITFTLTAPDTRSLAVAFGGVTGTTGLALTGTHTIYITAATTGNLTFTPTNAGTTITIDDVSIKPVTSIVTSAAGPLTFEAALTNEFAHEAAMRLNYTVDKTGAFNDTGLEINMIDTASGGTSTLLRAKTGTTDILGLTTALLTLNVDATAPGWTSSRGASGSSPAFSHTGTQSSWGSIFRDSGTVGVMNGSDTLSIFDAAITNSNHTGADNFVNAFSAGSITGDAEATESAVNVGTGWDYIINSAVFNVSGTGTATANGGMITKNAATSGGYVDFYEDSDNGTNYVRVTVPSAITSDTTLTLPTATGTLGVRTCLNVDEYGAVGDGTTDDTAAIQAAINAARTAGNATCVQLQNKTYKITATLNMKDGVTFRGSSQYLSGLVATTGFSMISTNALSYCTIENLFLNGPGIGTANAKGIVVSASSHRATIRDVYLTGFSTGIEVLWDSANISGAYITYCTTGVDAANTANAFNIVGSSILNCGQGINLGRLAASTQLSVRGCIIQENTANGIKVSGFSDSVYIDGNYFEENATSDIEIGDPAVSNVNITNNLFTVKTTNAFSLYLVADGVNIANNYFSGEPTTAAISTDTGAANVSIAGNIFPSGYSASKMFSLVSGTVTYFRSGTNGSVGLGVITPDGKLVVSPPATQTVAAGETITSAGCGTIRQITAAGPVTTSTTNTFTAPAAGNTGCCMDVVNVGANAITLDNNALFFSAGAADVVLGAADSVRVCSNGSAWYQIGATGNN